VVSKRRLHFEGAPTATLNLAAEIKHQVGNSGGEMLQQVLFVTRNAHSSCAPSLLSMSIQSKTSPRILTVTIHRDETSSMNYTKGGVKSNTKMGKINKAQGQDGCFLRRECLANAFKYKFGIALKI